MQIQFNGTPFEVEKNTTLESFLQKQGLASQGGVAVAVNNQVVSREQWPHAVLQENDMLLAIGACYGG